MRTRNKPVLIFFCLLLSAAAVLSGVNIYSELKERQKEKEDFAAVSQIAEPTPDELKSLPKGDFIVMKTGVHPMRVHLKLFFKWGIEFDDEHPYAVPDQGNREVKYADKKEIQDGILEKYPPEWKEETSAPSDADGGGQAQQNSPKNEPQRTPLKGERRGGKPIRTSPPKKETAPDITEAEIIKDLTETEVQSNEPS